MGHFDKITARLLELLRQTDDGPEPRRLDATSIESLATALAKLPPGKRGWITFADYSILLDTLDGGPREWNSRAGMALARLAADNGCQPLRVPGERRFYFTKDPA
jgi:hypothetical protein